MATEISGAEGSLLRTGLILEGGDYSPIESLELETEFDADRFYPTRIRAEARTAKGKHANEGDVLAIVPLRHRKKESNEVTRISEARTRWTLDNREGFGMAEFLDLMVDGMPAGARRPVR